jgi:hypothetical protein
MSSRLSAPAILDDAFRATLRAAPPWAGVLILTLIPYRFLQVHFIERLVLLGADAHAYGNYLGGIALLATLALLPVIWGRLVWARAVRAALSGRSAGAGEILRVPWRAMLACTYVTLAAHLFLCLFGVTIIGIWVALVLGGIAVGTAEMNERAGPLLPFRRVVEFTKGWGTLIGVTLVFFVAFVAVWINLFYAIGIAVWAAGALPAVDPYLWGVRVETRLFRLLSLATVAAILEPFWWAAWTSHVRRRIFEKTGEDLRDRFREIVRTKIAEIDLGTAPKIACFVLATGLAAMAVHAESSLPISQYLIEMKAIEAGLREGRLQDAADRALGLRDAEIRDGEDLFDADRGLLQDVADVPARSVEAPLVASRVRYLIEALEGIGSEEATGSDPPLLDELRRRSEGEPIERGGEVAALPMGDEAVWEQIAAIWSSVIEWLAARFEWLYDLIVSLWPRRDEAGERATFGGVPVVVLVTVIAVTLILLFVVLRIRKGPARPVTPVETGVASAARDADPLSRETGEWERYARELAQGGRYREAIRAWYHAVLVTLYRSGVLHYRRGVTNWEYLSMLSPHLTWRAGFAELTREFDREWYGGLGVDHEAVARFSSQARAIVAAVRAGAR